MSSDSDDISVIHDIVKGKEVVLAKRSTGRAEHEKGSLKSPFDYLKEHVLDWYEHFTDHGSTGLLLGDKLQFVLEIEDRRLILFGGKEQDFFSKFLRDGSMSDCIFVSYLWDKFLELHYLTLTSGQPSVFFLAGLIESFVTDIAGECVQFFNLDLMQKFARKIDDVGLKEIVKFDWFDVPAVLRMIAPTNKKVSSVSFEHGIEWCTQMLKGLQHEEIMLPWKDFMLGLPSAQFFDHDARVVSTKIWQKREI